MHAQSASPHCCSPSPSSARPLQAQEQSFAAFQAELWPDAQAKGITRATFDLALKGVTPDPRVIAATKRQPEYGKPVGAYVNDIVSHGRITRGQRQGQGMGEDLRRGREEIRVERWVLLALWGMETDYGAAKDKWDVFRSLATLGLCEISPSLFPQRAAGGDAHHAGRPLRARQDGELLGRRHGPDPVHAVERRRLRHRFFRRRQERHLDQRAGRARLHRQLSAQVEMEARPALGLRGQRAEGLRLHEEPRQLRRMEQARRAPRRRQAVPARPAKASCSSRAAPKARPSSSPRTIRC